jgi:hypothetical protein
MTDAKLDVLIRYESGSTVNGEPVGSVYVYKPEHLGQGTYSYTKDPRKATRFTESQARSLIQGKRWPHARTVFAHAAKALS